MAIQWLRLWHDMPNDPKWRTIARISKQSISEVIAVYVHILVIASNATERGRTQAMCSEDVASALDLETESVTAILSAMDGRVLDGDKVAGWENRQVEREDGSASRAKAWREAQKNAEQTQPNATERKQTPDKDKDKDKEESKKNTNTSPDKLPTCPCESIVELYHEALPELPKVRLMPVKRKKAIAKIWRWILSSTKKSDGSRRAETADQALDWFRNYFSRARSNDFLMGRTARIGDHANWQCDLDFLLTDKGMSHVIEKTREIEIA